jgi:RNA polymerase sigma-70 factor (ECF subfamily)
MIENPALSGIPADNQLVRRAAAGERNAFEEIVRRYKVKIHSYILRMAPNRQEAEDLTQEVFVRAYLALESLRHVSNVGTWLYRVASNICIDEYRKRDRTPGRVSLDDPPVRPDGGRAFELPGSEATPEQALLQEELKVKLASAIDRLPPKLRSVVLLFDIQSLSYEEIAEIERCPLGTVKSRLFNARAALRTMLAPYLDRVRDD